MKKSPSEEQERVNVVWARFYRREIDGHQLATYLEQIKEEYSKKEGRI